MSYKIGFDPTSDKWVLSDGEHYLEVPYWAREIIADEFERETRQLKADNAKLRERITTQKQTIQAYRDESREWREAAERAQAENDRLRELIADVHDALRADKAGMFHKLTLASMEAEMRELGVDDG